MGILHIAPYAVKKVFLFSYFFSQMSELWCYYDNFTGCEWRDIQIGRRSLCTSLPRKGIAVTVWRETFDIYRHITPAITNFYLGFPNSKKEKKTLLLCNILFVEITFKVPHKNKYMYTKMFKTLWLQFNIFGMFA